MVAFWGFYTVSVNAENAISKQVILSAQNARISLTLNGVTAPNVAWWCSYKRIAVQG